MKPEVKRFIEEYAEELVSGNAAYFVGAGISVNSNLPDWSGLIRPFTDKIGIDDIKGKDLPLMAQYVINEETGNRGPLINAISRKLRKSYSPNALHEAIAKTELKTIWTTNYDNLLEKAFAHIIADVKVNDEAIARDIPDTKIEIIKMHGCIYNSHRNDIVITQADYEDFFLNRPATSQRLRLDLLQKSFLFVGYGYNDPNIKNIVTEARRLVGNNTRQHYLVIKDDKGNKEFELWCRNLKRYGIQVVKIDQYEDLLPILEKLSLMSRGKSVFITGSHNAKNDTDAEELGRAFARRKDYIFNDGQSTGLMRIASKIFIETIVEEKSEINKRLKFFPNPYALDSKFANDASLLPLLKQWRAPLLRATHVMIAFDGGMGTKAEMEVALDVGCIVIPFFNDETKETWSMIDNPLVKDRLTRFSADYIDSVKTKDAKYTDVLDLVHKILQ